MTQTGPPTLLLLHHFGGSSRTWNTVIDRLEGLPHVAPNLRGFGGEPTAGRGFAVGDYVDDVIALMERMPRRWILVGHSMGGKIALAAAARKPPGLAGLVLVAPSPPTPEPMADAARRQLLAANADDATAGAVVGGAAAAPLEPGLFARTIADMRRADPAAWRAWCESGSRENLAAEIGKLDLPARVVVGSGDGSMTESLMRSDVLPHLPAARLEVIESCGHLVPLERPSSLATLLCFAAKEMAGG